MSVRDPLLQQIALCFVDAINLAISGPEFDNDFLQEMWSQLDELPDDIQADIKALVLARFDRLVREQHGISLIEFWDAWRTNQIH